MTAPDGGSPWTDAGGAGLILLLMAGLVSGSSWFLPWPPAVLDLSLALLALGFVLLVVAAFIAARQEGESFLRSLRASVAAARDWLLLLP